MGTVFLCVGMVYSCGYISMCVGTVYLCVSHHHGLCCRSNDPERFQQDLLNISRTTLSSKLLTHHKEHFSQLAVDAVLRLKGSGNLDAIHVIKKLGGSLTDSYLDEGLYWSHQGRRYWGVVAGLRTRAQLGTESQSSWLSGEHTLNPRLQSCSLSDV